MRIYHQPVEDGYTTNLPQQDVNTKIPLNKTVSVSNIYAYLMMEWEDQENYILFCHNLLNQFLVAMYTKIETERLSFIQKKTEEIANWELHSPSGCH